MDLDLPNTWRDAAPSVVPVLRHDTAPNNAWLVALDRAEAQLVRRPFLPFVDVLAVLDLPGLRLFLNAGHLESWDVDPDTVIAAALANLPPATGLQPWAEADGVWQLAADDGYASSRLALPGWLAAFQGRVKGRPVAVVPDNNTLLVTGEGAGLPLERALTEAWDRFHEVGGAVSPAACTVDPTGRVVPWHPGADHPLVHRAHAGHAFLAGHCYRDQQGPLEQWLIDHDIADLLAPYQVLRHPSGRVRSFACWPNGPTLLPRVEVVVLGVPGEGVLDSGPCVRWHDLVAAGCIHDPEPGLAPVRYRVGRWPAARPELPAVDPRE